MISLEQVRQLDIRVKKAVSAVKTLSAENLELKQKITGLEARISELADEAEGHRANEQELEVSLQGVLDVLDEVNGETAEIEPEMPADNYTIETVALSDESDEAESAETEVSEAPPEQPESSDDMEFPTDGAGEEVTASPTEISEDPETGADESVQEEKSPLPEEEPMEPVASEKLTGLAISEDVPGVGHVVEFERKSEESESAAETDDKQDNSDIDAAADKVEAGEEEVALSEDDVAESDDEFQSEFDIF